MRPWCTAVLCFGAERCFDFAAGADGSSSSVREWVAAWRAKQATGGHGEGGIASFAGNLSDSLKRSWLRRGCRAEALPASLRAALGSSSHNSVLLFGAGVPPPPLPAKQEVPKAPPPVTESSESDMAVPLMSNIASVFPTKEEAGAGLEEAKSIVTGSFVEDVRSIDMNMEMTVDVFTSSVEEALKQIKAPPSQPSPRDANKNRNK